MKPTACWSPSPRPCTPRPSSEPCGPDAMSCAKSLCPWTCPGRGPSSRRRGNTPAGWSCSTRTYRWRPHIQTLRKAIREEHVGRIGHILYECRQQIRRKTVDAWREKMPEPYLLDFAIHHFDLIRFLTGDEPTRLMGMSFRPSWSWFESNSAAAAILTLRSGAVADYGGTMVSQGLETPQEGLITVIGEKGTLHLDGESRVTLHGQGEVRTLPQEPIAGGELGYAMTEFLEAVRGKRQPETHVAEHIRSLALPLAVMESARRGAAVDLSEFTDFLK